MNRIHDLLDLSQTIEKAILDHYLAQPETTDQDVIAATAYLIEAYAAEDENLKASSRNLIGSTSLVFEAIKTVCESRLVQDAKNVELDDACGYKVPVRLLLVCLDRLHKSMQFWHKKAVDRGYLNYIQSRNI